LIATEADLPLIVDLALEAHKGSVWEDFAQADPESIRQSALALMERDDAAVFVCDRGVLMLARFPLWFNHDTLLTSEVFFYATKGGDALMREGRRWADGLMTVCRHDRTDPRLDKLYQRAGFVPIEHTFIGRA
jgi:hypothetical protein